jgi:hypothetical protein
MLEWVARLEPILKGKVRFVEVDHVDGRRFRGEFVETRETPNGSQIVLRDSTGREIRLYSPAIRNLTY